MTIYLEDFNDCEDYFYYTQVNEFESVNGFVAKFGQWCNRWYRLRDGIELIFSIDRYSDLALEGGSAGGILHFQFCLSGGIRIIIPHFSDTVDGSIISANHSLLSYWPEYHHRQYPAVNQQSQWIRIDCPIDFLDRFQRSFASFPQPVQKLIEGNFSQPIYQPGIITPMMQLVLQQMLQCPLRGTLKQMYLESKVLELLSLQFGQWVETEAPAKRSYLFRLDDKERLHHAKAILNKTYQNPPSLLELAQQVKLNDFKLKRGFKELFQTTVFGYVQYLRMEQAKQLLSGTELMIAEIAQQVGYESTSYFGYLFKREFGMTPKTYRQSFR
jgi:AraC family transcriptional regulator, transcriptional activator of the genes for pyochelin and ferripyochelin receptors